MIRNHSFLSYIKLKSLFIVKNVLFIGDKEFYNCRGLSSITFASKNEPTFGNDAFVYCQLNKVIVPNDCKYNKMKNMVK